MQLYSIAKVAVAVGTKSGGKLSPALAAPPLLASPALTVELDPTPAKTFKAR